MKEGNVRKWGMAIVVTAAGLVAGTSAVAISTSTATVASTSTSTSTAKAPCWVGSWQVTTATTTVTDKGLHYSVTGGAGIKLKLVKGGLAAFNFRKTKAQTGSGVVNGAPITASLQLDKQLNLGFIISGDKKGKLAAKPKTATGDATAVLKLGTKTTSSNIAAQFLKNRDQGAIPRKGSFSCVSNSSLVITTSVKSGTLLQVTRWVLKHS
jgi:hypothetical protein